MNQSTPADTRCCPVLELRQYTLKHGDRDKLVDLFERHFVESQEAVGMALVGQFRDRQNPDRFVWLRGFADMESRHKALESFYGGKVWATYRDEANSTMLDSDNVLLLKPATPESSFHLRHVTRENVADDGSTEVVLAGIYQLPQPADSEVIACFEQRIAPVLNANRVRLEGVFVTESTPNTFTRLPVREGENVLVWFGSVAAGGWSKSSFAHLVSLVTLNDYPVSLLELEPTTRSLLGRGRNASRASKHDFDFLFGSWKIHNRFLKARLCHSTEWTEFEAEAKVEPLLDGFGHLDRYTTIRGGKRFEGMTLRLFNPETGEWTIHWADTARARTLLPPIVGRFLGDVGEFCGDETVDGKKVRCRFRWIRSPSSPRWEQAFSDDDGKTWETNWIMTLTRP